MSHKHPKLHTQVQRFQRAQKVIIEAWLAHPYVDSEITKLMPIKTFRNEYANPIFDVYIKSVVEGEIYSTCPVVERFIDATILNGLTLDTLHTICTMFHKSLVNFAISEGILDTDMYDELMANMQESIASVIHYYTVHTQTLTQLQQAGFVKHIGKDLVLFSHTIDTKEIVFVSQAVQKVFELEPAEMIGKAWDTVIAWSEVDKANANHLLTTLLNGDTEFNRFDMHFTTASGKEKVVQVRNHVVRDDMGNMISVDGVVEDMTQLYETQGGLISHQEMLDISQEIAHLGSWELDLVSGALTWSKEVYHIFELDINIPPDYAHFLNVIHPQDRALVDEAYKASVEQKTAYDVEHRLLMPDGRLKYLHEVGKTYYDSEGNALKSIGAVHDITERKRAEKRLEESEGYLRMIMASAIDGVVSIDEHGYIQSFNPAAETLFGYTQDEVIGRNVSLLVPSPHKEQHDHYIQNYLDTGIKKAIGRTAELPAVRKNGTQFMASIRIGEIEFKEYRVFTALIQDITDRKEMERSLIEAKNTAEHAARSKSDFLANMSHEIRTPMNAIIGMSHLALQTQLDDKQRNYIEKVHRSAEMLLGIINDILDVSKIEAESLELEIVPFSLNTVMEDLFAFVEVSARSKGIELMYLAKSDLPVNLKGDALRLGQILLNLVSNAIKFSHDNADVTVGAELKSEDKDRAKLHFWVQDRGIGMNDAQMAKLFRPFTQADTSTTRKYGGTGLGLVICKRLTELMQGEIWVESEEGVGSTFHIEIDFDKQENARDVFDDTVLGSIKILLVDDNENARMIMAKMLRNFNFEVDEAVSGKEGITRAVDENGGYDVVITDWKMRDLDGVQMVDAIQSNTTIKQPHIIMITAHGRDEMQEVSAQVNVDSFLSKPITFSKLHDAVVDSLQVSRKSRVVKPQRTDNDYSSLAGAKILLVEDNEVNQELAQELLESNGMQVSIAAHGREALAILEENPAFDAILMDCQMPVMDGYTATKMIRKQEAFEELPIIALTANAMVGEKQKVLASGMNDHISKPIRPNEMLDTMAKWISNSAPTPLKTPKTEDKVISLPNIIGIDTQKGLITTQNSVSLYKKILRRFAQNQANFAEDFVYAYETEDSESMTRLAHTLKGVSGNIGAMKLFTESGMLEQACKNNDRAAIDELFESCVEQLTPILQALNALEREEAVERSAALNVEEVKALINRLEGLIDEYDTEAADVLDALQQVAGIKVHKSELDLVRDAVEAYDFEKAKSEIIKLKSIIL